ncbi:hypothetical protein DUNSADRAFT_5778, partial [Dunaliella salina]
MFAVDTAKLLGARAYHSSMTLPSFDTTRVILFQSVLGLAAAAAAGFGSGALRWQPIADSRAIGWVMAYALGRVVME